MHFLEEIYPIVPTGIKRYCEKNAIVSLEQVPICDRCGVNHVTYNKAYSNRGFSKHCSPACSRANKTVSKQCLELLSDHDWLYEQRITLRKSYDTIALELGVSAPVVDKWISIHNIPRVRYNASEYDVKEKLQDSALLNSLYQTGITMDAIAQEIGSSKSSVSIMMQKFGIEARAPNSYERSNNYRSAGEIELYEYIKSIYPGEVLHNKRSVIAGQELDIWIPDRSLAIEFNGVYYHSDRFKTKDFHQTKTNLCREKDITLLHVWEDSWKKNPELVKSMVKNKLGLTQNKIYARKCRLGVVPTNVSRLFLEENHTQGYSASAVKVGLYLGDELVALMTMSAPRFNRKYDWELVRYATKQDTNVVGGFSRLLKYFRTGHPGSIVTYADLSYSYGNVYYQNGFTLLTQSPPGFWYVHKDTRVPRTTFTKKKLLAQGCNPSKSEREIVQELGIVKIWNSGTLTFVLK